MTRLAFVWPLILLAGCASPKATIAVQGTLNKGTVERWRQGQPDYKAREELLDYLLGQPPAPALYRPTPPRPRLPGVPWKPYKPLLDFLHTGPGGIVVDEKHLQAIQAPLMAFGAFLSLPGNQNLSLAQLANTPQAQAVVISVRQVFSPLGLWNTAVGQWLRNNLRTLRPLLVTLYRQLLAGPPAPPGTPPPQPPVIVFDPVLATQLLLEVLSSRDWVDVAGRGPPLLHSLTRHLGYLEPQIVIYGRRREGYGVGVIMENPDDIVHVINKDGYTTNPPGQQRYHQGPNDLTLSYFAVKVRNGKVDTPELEASELFRWAKEAYGGDVSLLGRTRHPVNSMVKLDLDWEGTHLRLAAGATPHQTLASLAIEQRLGSADSTAQVRGAAGLLYETAFGGEGTSLGYAEIEAVLRTKRWDAVGDGGRASARLQTTLALAGLVGEHVLQGDARLVPELLLDLDLAEAVRIEFTMGFTVALVPYGKVNLKHPLRSLAFRRVLTHAKFRIEADAGPVVLEWGAIGEWSGLRTRARLWTGVSWGDANIKSLVTLEKFGNYLDSYLGVALAYGGLTANVLQQIDGDRYIIQAGFEHQF